MGEVANSYDNLRIPVTAADRIKGDIPYYGANGIQDYVKGYTHDGEFVLIAEEGASDLINYPVKYVHGKVWINNHAHVISGKINQLNNLFLSTVINSINLIPYLVGGGRAKLNGEVLNKLNIFVPIIDEQEKIGSLFQTLDALIASNQLQQKRRFLGLKNVFLSYLYKTS